MRLRRVLALGSLLLVSLGARSVSAGDPAKLLPILRGSIIEGQRVGAIRLGAGEDEMVSVLGVPDRLDSSYSGASVDLKIAHYATASPPTILRVILRAGCVEAVLVVAADLSRAVELSGKPRGVGLGSLIADVRKAYGTPRAGRLWYPAAGIAFNPAETDPSDRDRVYAILTARPGLDVELVGAYGRLH